MLYFTRFYHVFPSTLLNPYSIPSGANRQFMIRKLDMIYVTKQYLLPHRYSLDIIFCLFCVDTFWLLHSLPIGLLLNYQKSAYLACLLVDLLTVTDAFKSWPYGGVRKPSGDHSALINAPENSHSHALPINTCCQLHCYKYPFLFSGMDTTTAILNDITTSISNIVGDFDQVWILQQHMCDEWKFSEYRTMGANRWNHFGVPSGGWNGRKRRLECIRYFCRFVRNWKWLDTRRYEFRFGSRHNDSGLHNGINLWNFGFDSSWWVTHLSRTNSPGSNYVFRMECDGYDAQRSCWHHTVCR